MNSDGFLIVDKSPGMTSHDVVAIARRALGTRKVGHAGTLDPMATGVLVLGFGNGTRLLQYITEGEKTYRATIVLGASTVTDDMEGEILSVATAAEMVAISDGDITRELHAMRGVISQRPSSVSAVKVNGERAYARVRAGEDVKLAPREVRISQLDILSIEKIENKIEVEIEVTCSAGTFIRAIARDCGDALAVGGHLSSLRRTRVASFSQKETFSVEQLKSGDFLPLSIEKVAEFIFPLRHISPAEKLELSFGRSLTLNQSDEIVAALAEGTLVALLSNRDEKAHPIAVFAAKN